MNYNLFVNNVKTLIEDRIRDSNGRVTIQSVQKNNGIILKGVAISECEGNIAPTFYLEQFYDMHREGVPMANIIDMLMNLYEKYKPDKNLDITFYTDFERVKDKICFKLISKEMNKELLEHIPYIDYLDMAICFYCIYNSPELGEGFILVRKSHMEEWQVNVDKLMCHAQINTPRLLPFETLTMKDFLKDMIEIGDGAEDSFPMFILTNKAHVNGAGTILYPGVLSAICNTLGGDFYILPSSVHEVLILPWESDIDEDYLKNTIKKVNEEQVLPEEFLSDNLYFFDYETENVTII